MYSRKHVDAKQEIHMFLSSNPLGFPDHEMRIQPVIRIKVPSVSKVATEMVPDAFNLANAPELVVAQPLETLQQKGSNDRWLANTEDQLLEICDKIFSFIAQHGIPFLTEYCSVQGIIDSYEREDTRLLRQQHSYVFVAAAYVLQGNQSKAKAVLEKHLGTPGLRSRFSTAHEYVRHNKRMQSDLPTAGR